MSTSAYYPNTTHFKFYTTPLMLACLLENYDLIGLFLKSGHVLNLPHGADCKFVYLLFFWNAFFRKSWVQKLNTASFFSRRLFAVHEKSSVRRNIGKQNESNRFLRRRQQFGVRTASRRSVRLRDVAQHVFGEMQKIRSILCRKSCCYFIFYILYILWSVLLYFFL